MPNEKKPSAASSGSPRATSKGPGAGKTTPTKASTAGTPARKKPATKEPAAKASPASGSTTSGRSSGATKPAAAKKKKTTAAEPAAAKKTPAAKKAPAKKTPAKKTPTAKPAAAKKPPAAKKAAAAKKPPAAKKAAATEAVTKPVPAKKASASAASPFKVGDAVVYPHHGAATIVRKEKQEFDGERQDYFVLEVATDQLTVRVPIASAVELGVRPVISKTVAAKVFRTFKGPPEEAGSNWSRWYKLLTEKINSGDIFQVAEVVRDLTYAQQTKGISPALKRMLAKARTIIVSEFRFALGIEEEEAEKRLDRSLPKVEPAET